VKRCLNSSKALNGREMALDPKGKDELVKYILYLEECVYIGHFTHDMAYACCM
jgi:hypothetical protein